MSPTLANLRRLAKLFARYFDYDKGLAKNEADPLAGQARARHGHAPGARGAVRGRRRARPRQPRGVAERCCSATSTGSCTRRRAPRRRRARRSRAAGRPRSARKSAPTRTCPGLVGARTEGENQAILAARKTGFPFYFPTLRDAGGSYVGEPGPAAVHDPRRAQPHPPRLPARALGRAERRLLRHPGHGLAHARRSSTTRTPRRTVNGRKLLIYRDGNKVRLVAWKTPRGVYWVSNTLTRALNERQMIAIAASLRRLRSH